MAERGRHSGESRAFHLEVGNLVTFELKGFEILKHPGHCQALTHHAALGTVEAACGHCHTLHGDGLEELDKPFGGTHEVRIREMGVPVAVLLEGLFEIEQADLVAVRVPVEHAVGADADMAAYEGAKRNLGLNCTACAYAHQGEALVLGLDLAGGEVHVGQGVELGGHDVDIVGTYSMRQGGDALAVVETRYEGEFTRLPLGLDLFEVGNEHLHAPGVAHEEHGVGQFGRFDVDVKYRSVAVDDEFRFWNSHDY